jgi:hypothetical protein
MSEERKRAGLVAPEMMNPQEGLPAPMRKITDLKQRLKVLL